MGGADEQLRQLPKVGCLHGVRPKHAAVYVSRLCRFYPAVHVLKLRRVAKSHANT